MRLDLVNYPRLESWVMANIYDKDNPDLFLDKSEHESITRKTIIGTRWTDKGNRIENHTLFRYQDDIRKHMMSKWSDEDYDAALRLSLDIWEEKFPIQLPANRDEAIKAFGDGLKRFRGWKDVKDVLIEKGVFDDVWERKGQPLKRSFQEVLSIEKPEEINQLSDRQIVLKHDRDISRERFKEKYEDMTGISPRVEHLEWFDKQFDPFEPEFKRRIIFEEQQRKIIGTFSPSETKKILPEMTRLKNKIDEDGLDSLTSKERSFWRSNWGTVGARTSRDETITGDKLEALGFDRDLEMENIVDPERFDELKRQRGL